MRRRRGGLLHDPDAMFSKARRSSGVKQRKSRSITEQVKRKLLVPNKRLPFLKNSREYRLAMELKRAARSAPIGASREDVILRVRSSINKSKTKYIKKSDVVLKRDLYAFFDLLVKKGFIEYKKNGL